MDRIECVARALCKADGKNPDGMHRTGKIQSATNGGLTNQELAEQPNWKAYESEARRFVAAYDAITAEDDERSESGVGTYG